MRPRSIRARTTLVASAISAVVLSGAAVVVVLALRTQLADNLDEGLAQRADTLAGAVGAGPLPGGGDDDDLLVQVVDGTGVVVLASDNLAGAPPIAPLEPGLRTGHALAGSGTRFRVLTRPLDTPTGPRWLLVGVNVDDVTDPVTITARLLGAAVPASVALLAALTWWLTGRTLRPVEHMRAELAEISATNPSARVDAPGTGDEVDRLAGTMNDTLDRLEDALRRQQRFVADASHELRGPLTRLRAELEVGLEHPDPDQRRAAADGLLAETIELQRLVEDLLLLARIDAPAATPVLAPVDLDDTVLRAARRVRERGRVRVDLHEVSAAQVRADADQIGRAVRNLFDNAERHAARTITVGLHEAGGVARLTIGDDGAGIPPAERERVFERFTRLDEARTRDAGGAGLGLAISRAIVERHGGTLRLADGPATVFVLELPANP